MTKTNTPFLSYHIERRVTDATSSPPTVVRRVWGKNANFIICPGRDGEAKVWLGRKGRTWAVKKMNEIDADPVFSGTRPGGHSSRLLLIWRESGPDNQDQIVGRLEDGKWLDSDKMTKTEEIAAAAEKVHEENRSLANVVDGDTLIARIKGTDQIVEVESQTPKNVRVSVNRHTGRDFDRDGLEVRAKYRGGTRATLRVPEPGEVAKIRSANATSKKRRKAEDDEKTRKVEDDRLTVVAILRTAFDTGDDTKIEAMLLKIQNGYEWHEILEVFEDELSAARRTDLLRA